MVCSVLSWTYLRQGDVTEAQRYADEVYSWVMDTKLPLVTHHLLAYALPTEIYLRLWETNLLAGQDAATKLLTRVRHMLRTLRIFVWMHPVGRPRYYLHVGR